MKRFVKWSAPVVGLGALVVLIAGPASGSHTARADLIDTNGNTAGEVRFVASGNKVAVTARVQLPPEFAGFHGFHVHAKGVCDKDALNAQGARAPFSSAAGHYGFFGQLHHAHDGDMPVLLVNGDGTASMTFVTDRLSLSEIMDADGSAVIVHVGRDNLANIPTRYAANGPDADTHATGDAGARLACGVVK